MLHSAKPIRVTRQCKHGSCKPRRDRKRTCGVELLSAAVSVHDGGGLSRYIDISFASATVSVSRFDSVYRLRVLSSVAREKMPASNERHFVDALVGFCSLCLRLDLFSADHGKRDSRFRSSVIP